MKKYLTLYFLLLLSFDVLSSEIHPPTKKSFQKIRSFDVGVPSRILHKKEHGNLENDTYDITEKEAKILSSYQTVIDENLLINFFSQEDIISLPIGIKKTVADKDFIIVIDNVRITPLGTFVNVGLVIDFPESDNKLVFGAFNVEFSQERGFGGVGKLALLNDHRIALSESITLDFKGFQKGGQTHINWGCDGYQSMALDFDVVFDSTMIRPADQEGNLIKGEKIKANIKAEIESFDELILQVDLPNFRLGPDHDRGFTFCAEDVIYDQSDTSNGNVTFPENYHSSDFIGQDQNLWKGFYIRRAMVMLPSELDKVRGMYQTNDTVSSNNLKKYSTTRTKIQVSNLILDKSGVSGNFQGHYLLSLKNGKVGDGWAFSIHKVEVELLKNQFQKAGFDGQLQLPISEDSTSTLDYSAEVGVDGHVRFFTAINNELQFAPFGDRSELRIDRTGITLEIVDDQFLGGVHLDGKMSVADSKSDLELVGIDFQQLTISTQAPYLSVEVFGISSEYLDQKVLGKTLQINELSVSDQEGRFTLTVEGNVCLHSDSEAFGGGGRFDVIAKNDEEGWRYDRTDISGISIDVSKKDTYDIKGTIHVLKDDPVYGDVFIGVIEVKIGPLTKSDGLGAEGTILFGKKDGHNYWYVDALIVLPSPGLTVGTFSFLGFGGGLYYGMERATYANNIDKSSMVKSATGGVYLPNSKIGLGLKAIIIFSIPNENTLVAETTFEMSFFKRGGIQKAIFVGCANIMSGVANALNDSELASLVENDTGNESVSSSYDCAYISPESAPIFASLIVELDFENGVFHGELNVVINAGIIEGGGLAVIHFEENLWYIHIGTNENPIYLSLLGAVEATSYFMLGHNMPEGFKAPDEVAEILGYDPEPEGTQERDLEALSSGQGIAFGSSLHIQTGEMRFLIFYAQLQVGFGFDVMLKNYGSSAVCLNTGKRIGINGWYAQGQMYTYIATQIGIKVNLFFVKGKFEIIDAGFAALLKFKGPNPMYAYGTVGGYFNILGGLVKGNCRFEFTLGEECRIGGSSPLGGIEIIASMSPFNDTENVDVFAVPQIVFNVPIEEEMTLLDPNTERKRQYKLHVRSIKLKDSSASEAAGDLIWNEDHTTLVFAPHSMLKNEEEYTFEIILDFRVKKGNDWVEVNSDDVLGRTVKFKSGKRPDKIDYEKVQFAYPLEKQMNFYKQEASEGYLEMKQSGWDYLFTIENPDEWDVKVRFTSLEQKVEYSEVDYNDQLKKVAFNIPASLNTNTIYSLEIVHIPKVNLDIDQNVKENSSDLSFNNVTENETSVELTTRDIEGETLENKDEKIIYHSTFRTSYFSTFHEKMSNLNIGGAITGILPYSLRKQMKVFIPTYYNETLDRAELIGNEKTSSLLTLEVDFSDPFYKEYINPLIYSDYPLYGAELSWRTEDEHYGWVKPDKAVYIYQNSEGYIDLSNDEIASGILENHDGYELIYNPDYVIGRDYRDFQTALEDLAAEGNLEIENEFDRKITNIIRSGVTAPSLIQGVYHVLMKYTLPGKTSPNSIYKMPLTNVIQ